MNQSTIPGYIAFGVSIAVLVGYYVVLLGLGYVSIHALGGMATDLDALEISSLLNLIHATWLVAAILFLSLIIMLLVLSAPYLTKEIVTRPFRQTTHNRSTSSSAGNSLP